MADDQPKSVQGTNDKIGFGMIITVVILVGLAVFVIQNMDSTPVEFLFFSASLPLWLVVVVSVALGVVLGWIWRWMSRRRKQS